MADREERRGPDRPFADGPGAAPVPEVSDAGDVAGMPRTAQASGVEAAPAATVVLVRDGEHGLEVLLAKRSSQLKFHGGAWVFPGGRIDPEDYAGAPDDLLAAARRAAAREAKEEAGLDVDAEPLVHISNWTTPEISPKRFATWFFVGEVAGGEELADGVETDRLHWFRPDDAFAARASGDIELAPPQYVTLLWLRDHGTVADALRAAREGDPVDYTPRFHFVDGDGAVCVYRGDVAYDDRGRLDEHGPQHRLYLRDSGWEYVRDESS
jgi:8-oxo-dGTP pyrophosphatase MutT (NUDIX family)